MDHSEESKPAQGQITPPRRPEIEPPGYEPPTLDQLALLQKGGGGDTIDKKYLARRTEKALNGSATG